MQITINSILTFMRDKQNFNISEEQEQEIKAHFYKTAGKHCCTHFGHIFGNLLWFMCLGNIWTNLFEIVVNCQKLNK